MSCMFILQNSENFQILFKIEHHLSHNTEITVVNILAYFFPVFFLCSALFILCVFKLFYFSIAVGIQH